MNSIIAGIMLALLGWLYTRYQTFMEMYRHMKQELEQMRKEMTQLGATKEEFERLRESLRWSETRRQKLQRQLEEERHEKECIKAEEARKREEIQRQFETQRENQELIKTEIHYHAISDEDFIELCREGDSGKVNDAIRNGANVNARNIDGETALTEVAQLLDCEISELLLQHGADVNIKDNDGWTALMHVAFARDAEATKLLLKYGADPNATSYDGCTALMLLIGNVYTKEAIEIILLLLGYGANINARDDKGRTVLMLAATHINTKFVEFLLILGAYVNAEDLNGRTALSETHYRPIGQPLTLIRRKRVIHKISQEAKQWTSKNWQH